MDLMVQTQQIITYLPDGFISKNFTFDLVIEISMASCNLVDALLANVYVAIGGRNDMKTNNPVNPSKTIRTMPDF